MLIQNNRVSIRIEENELHYSATSRAMAFGSAARHDLTIDLAMVKSYKVTKNWLFGYRLYFLIEIQEQTDHCKLPLPGLRKAQLKDLINAINQAKGQC